MLIYNVTIKLDSSIEKQWVHWMQEEHMPALYDTGCFERYHLHKLLEQDESDGVTYVAQYYCASREEYEQYINEHAPAMRNAGIQRFGDKFIAFRTLMEKVF